MTKIAVTGASGQLGRIVVDDLLKTVAPQDVVSLVRDVEKVGDWAARGVTVRPFDYNRPETLATALAGVDRLLLISSSEIGQRARQHEAVIAAAKTAGVGFIAYTSLLHADTSTLNLADEHRATEALLEASGIDHAILRNGWYTENYAQGAPTSVAHGAVLGSAGDGRISGASRADYAAAAVAVVTADTPETRIHELAGDEAFTLTDYAAALAEISGKPVVYKNLPEPDYAKVLEGVGLPPAFAGLLAESDAKAAKGALFDDSRALGKLIGRPTTPWRDTVAKALRG